MARPKPSILGDATLAIVTGRGFFSYVTFSSRRVRLLSEWQTGGFSTVVLDLFPVYHLHVSPYIQWIKVAVVLLQFDSGRRSWSIASPSRRLAVRARSDAHRTNRSLLLSQEHCALKGRCCNGFVSVQQLGSLRSFVRTCEVKARPNPRQDMSLLP